MIPSSAVMRVLFRILPTATSPALCTKVFTTLSLYVVDVYNKELLLQYFKQMASRAGHFESLYLKCFIIYVRIVAVSDPRTLCERPT